MINRKEAPKSTPITQISLPAPQTISLHGDSSLYIFRDKYLDLLHITIEVAGGRIYESRKYVAQALFSFLKESSSQYPKEKMDQLLDYYGSSWNTSINIQNATIELIIPKRNFNKIYPIIIETIVNPTFNSENFEDFKKSKIKNLEYNIRKNSYIASQLMLKNIYQLGTPLGTPLEREHIENLSIDNLKEYHQQIFQANRINIFAAGNIEDDETHTIIQTFQQLSKSSTPIIPTTSLQTQEGQFIYEPRENSLQSTILLYKKLFDYNHTDRREFNILNTLLGGYFGSRLMQKVREECGYTYSIYSENSYICDHSIFFIESDVIEGKADESIEACFEEIKRLQTEEICDEELSTLKTYLSGAYLRSVDGITSYMKTYIRWHKFGLNEEEMGQLFATIKKISPQTILSLANRYLQRETISTIIVGKH